MSGQMPNCLGNFNEVEILHLNNNNFSGQISQFLGNMSTDLKSLSISSNNFQGKIPAITCDKLIALDLGSNLLEGFEPRFLSNCVSLEILNLENNLLNEAFPHWLDTLPNLKVLALRSNNLYGSVRSMKNVEKEDKTRPEYIETLGGYFVSIEVKGIAIQITRIPVSLVSIDFSSNKFEGDIPKSLGELGMVCWLNFSQNSLTNHIPSSLGSLKLLESLDLSNNKLTRNIPQELASLTFLEVFCVSLNQLEGPIPQSTQLTSMGENSYVGSRGLCGLPLRVKCGAPPMPMIDSKVKLIVHHLGTTIFIHGNSLLWDANTAWVWVSLPLTSCG
ncbi:receptor-like protein 12 [Chenopodium quinoa]|uniref:receptor-like protein 12 n=1 Tax=Chenopodium quinoa TaxID=63459 RepID=UPI000B782F74|nr:receptor-like protein 12 [Chenopodium quinoa]